MSRRYNIGLPTFQRGFSLVAAIFVLVVLAMLGAFMVTIGETSRATTVAAAQGARAYQAAQAGIEWGVAQAVPIGGGPGSCVASTGPFVLAGTAFGGFSITVTCASTVPAPMENGISYNVYAIASTATFGAFGNSDYFSRTLQVTVTSAP
ncbi:MAG TPA: agglutinin biogenesis protein MshP [Burkholderiales bacterium]